MIEDKIIYFEKEGNGNFPGVIEAVYDYIERDKTIKNVVVFAGRLKSVFNLQERLSSYRVKITVATYASGRKFERVNDEKEEYIVPEVTKPEAKKKILEANMNYIQGGLPFEPILSCTGDNATEMIISSYGTISKGLTQCVSAAIMAFENGYVGEKEKIIAMSGDTAIVVTPTIRREMFCGNFKIHKIICKPI